jgi:hypothetical protein
MSNPFAGIITQGFKDLHKNIIDALLEDTALTVACTLIYSATKPTECLNCIINNVSGKSSGRYKSGGPIPFTNGQCPYCYGAGKTVAESTDILYLMPIWDKSKWILDDPAIKVADISVQTMSKITTYADLARCSKIKIDNAIENLGTSEFTRLGVPHPIAFGASNHIITSWKRA